MPDEITQETMLEIFGSEPGPEPQATEPQVTEPAAPAYTKEQLVDIFRQHGDQLTHDDLKHIAGYNAHVSRALNKLHSEAEQMRGAYSQLQSQYNQVLVSQWDQWFDSLSPEQFKAAMGDPRYAQIYHQVSAAKNGQTPGPQSQPTQNVGAVRRQLQEDPEWGTILTDDVWDRVTSAPDATTALKAMLDAGKEHISKAERKRVEAQYQAELAKRHGQLVEPTSSQAGAAGTPGRVMTMEEYIRLSPEQAAKLTPSQIDAILARSLESVR